MNGFNRAQSELAVLLSPFRTTQGDVAESVLSMDRRQWVCRPLFSEILIDDSVLPIERPMDIAHEWGHLADCR